MKCPRCAGNLETITYESIRLETCSCCKGEWLDDLELGHVNRVREIRFDPEERRAVAQAATITGVRLDDADRNLACPKCGGRTDAVNFGGNSGMIIDRCTGCGGIWLDADELEKVQMLVEGWEDCLEGDLAKHGPRLRRIAEQMDRRDDCSPSRFGFINAVINGILDVLPRSGGA